MFDQTSSKSTFHLMEEMTNLPWSHALPSGKVSTGMRMSEKNPFDLVGVMRVEKPHI